jgi:hypothetical protein
LCVLQGIFVEKHFEPDAQLSFSLVEEDPVTKQPVSTAQLGVEAWRVSCGAQTADVSATRIWC